VELAAAPARSQGSKSPPKRRNIFSELQFLLAALIDERELSLGSLKRGSLKRGSLKRGSLEPGSLKREA